MKRVCIKLLRKNITYPYPIFCFFFIFYFFVFIFIFFNFSKLPKVHQRGEKKKKKFYICTLVTLLYLKLLSIIILTKQQVDLHLIYHLNISCPSNNFMRMYKKQIRRLYIYI